jgi:glutamate synthase domain-containing protein 2
MSQIISGAVGRVVYPGLLACALLAAGCATTSQTYSAQIIAAPSSASLKRGDLAGFGIAFITPSTVTGQEEDKPALALAFSKSLEEQLPNVHVVPLTETLTSVNRAGLFENYRRMITEYRDSGLLDRTALEQVGKATGARYIALLNMASFQQVYHDRLGVLGLRVLQTKEANIRITLQIWNSLDGSIAWEGSQELHMASETAAESAVSFGSVVEAAAKALAAKFP